MAKIVIDLENCKGCGLCVEVCPQKLLRPIAEINKKGVRPVQPLDPEKCTGCRLCTLVCPDVVITIYDIN